MLSYGTCPTEQFAQFPKFLKAKAQSLARGSIPYTQTRQEGKKKCVDARVRLKPFKGAVEFPFLIVRMACFRAESAMLLTCGGLASVRQPMPCEGHA